MDIFEAFYLLSASGMRHLVLVDGENNIAGVLTQSDIVKGLTVQFGGIRDISVVMNRVMVKISPSDSMQTVMRLMAESGVSCIVVKEQYRLCGIVTERDVTGFLAGGADPAATAVDKVMSSPVMTVDEKMPIHEVVRLMDYRKIRRFVVVNDKGEITGLATQTDIVNGILSGKYIESLREILQEKKEMLKSLETTLLEKSANLYISEQKYKSIFENSMDGIYVIALDGRILDINRAGAEMFGLSRSDLEGRNITGFYKNPSEREQFLEVIDKNHYVKDYPIDFVGKDGQTIHALVTTIAQRDALGNILACEGIIRNVTEQKKREEIIRHMAFHDHLTGLPNRQTFTDRLATELAHSRRNKTKGAVMFLDLDHFKPINDTFGHDMGDELLKNVAYRLTHCLREADTVARMGGDEFTIMLPRITSENDYLTIAEKILEAIRTPFTIEGHELKVSSSIGVSLFPRDGDDPETLIKKADDAMYLAKRGGKDNCRVYSGD
jgi:diguanylate cyclase (GGDEF)-like protein/PAS domain S-box-containing protein